MNYIMKAGKLYASEKFLAQIKSVFTGPEKKILYPDGVLLLRTKILHLKAPHEKSGDVRLRKYVMLDAEGNEFAAAAPDYALEEAPEAAGWPVCRLPKVGHARLSMAQKEYYLVMQNSKNYFLMESSGKVAIQIFHRGLEGGWNINAENSFSPEAICGIFIFCRYIEQENELLIV